MRKNIHSNEQEWIERRVQLEAIWANDRIRARRLTKDIRATERKAERLFRETPLYKIGRLAEEKVSNYLTSIGYEVKDISSEKYKHYWSPFDILAISEHYSFLADVKFRSSKGSIPISIRKTDFYLDYKMYESISNRIVIVCTPGLQDSFISTSDISKQCVLSSLYLISRESMTSISWLRKLLENGIN